ncbi:MAG TPA: hypothetical protein VF911_09045 [Thermoanaerobaculia bacterium]
MDQRVVVRRTPFISVATRTVLRGTPRARVQILDEALGANRMWN